METTLEAAITLSACTFICQILSKGVLTKERAKQYDLGKGMCSECPAHTENLAHVFFFCQVARQTWTLTLICSIDLYLHLINPCSGKPTKSTLCLLIVYETLFAMGNIHNPFLQGTLRETSPKLTTYAAFLHVKAPLLNQNGKKKDTRLTETLNWVDNVITVMNQIVTQHTTTS
jgi:hypothetical protein